jgi:hypothetical protein
MEVTSAGAPLPGQNSGFSVVLAERVLSVAHGLGVAREWEALGLGHPSGRATAYAPAQRLAAVVAGLACGLRGLAPGNRLLRPNGALRQRLGGRFPDQGTVHRWLQQVTPAQAAALRRHLHRVVRRHGHVGQALCGARPLVVDLDGQGLVARGRRFARARAGYLGAGVDRGYQRYVCYAGATGEVLDEWLAPGNTTLMSALPDLLRGLNEVIAPAWRGRVVRRGDAHLGTVANLRRVRAAGYHYLCPLYSYWSKQKLRRQVQGRRGAWFRATDSTGRVRRIQYWRLPRCRLVGKGARGAVSTHATVYRECRRAGARVKEAWIVLVTDLPRPGGRQLWRDYNQRGGTIEEYNDQSERGYHLEVMRTGNFAGLSAVQSLVGLCWNLTRWASAGLRLPPPLDPAADRAGWVAAARLDLSQLLERAGHSGLRLHRPTAAGPLEVEDTVGSPESRAWLAWLDQPIQQHLRFAG